MCRATLAAIIVLWSVPLFAQSGGDTFDSSAGPVKITPIMHASVLIRANGRTIYIDPAQGKYDNLPQADLIIMTDIHGDHMSPDNVRKLSKSGTVVMAPKAVADILDAPIEWRDGYIIPSDRAGLGHNLNEPLARELAVTPAHRFPYVHPVTNS